MTVPAIALRLQCSQNRLRFEPIREWPKHNEIWPEVTQHGPDLGGVNFARDEPELVEHVGQKHPHMSFVFHHTSAWRNRPASEWNNLAPVLVVVIVDHGSVPPRNLPYGNYPGRIKHFCKAIATLRNVKSSESSFRG
jgi:hypothetical protein